MSISLIDSPSLILVTYKYSEYTLCMDIDVEKNNIVDGHASAIWDYMLMGHTLQKVDAIFVLGSQDLSVPKYAAELYHQGYAKMIICSGGLGKLTDGNFVQSEADTFKAVLLREEIPESAILLENRATNTGENIIFTKELLRERNIIIDSFILIHKPYMERRTYATFKKQWPGPEIFVTSPDISFEDYTQDPIQREVCIQVMVGDLQRIKKYPEQGFQIEQNIPDHIWDAYGRLIEMGYTKYLIT